jgi:hypothetical protein
MCEHLVAEDGIRDLGSMDKIHFEETGLQRPLFRFVVLQGVQQE